MSYNKFFKILQYFIDVKYIVLENKHTCNVFVLRSLRWMYSFASKFLGSWAHFSQRCTIEYIMYECVCMYSEHVFAKSARKDTYKE